jgi:hypothetical protein
VVPDGASPDIATNTGDDAGGTSGDNSYSGGGGDGGTPKSDGGSTGPKSDGGSTSTGSCAFTGALATYDFSGESGDQTSTAAKTKATGVTASDVKRATALTAVSGSDSINASGWATATHVDTSKYYTVTITPPSGCALDVTALSVSTSASGSGPSNGAVATSDDSFSAKTNFTPGSTANPLLSVSGSTTATEIRIYGYGATSASGTMRMQNTLTITGSLE